MCFEDCLHTLPPANAFDVIANAPRQAHGDIDVDPHERRLEIRDAAGGWPLIDLSIDDTPFPPCHDARSDAECDARRDRTRAVGNPRTVAHRRRMIGSRD
jgi:hypothetical protein